MISTIKRRIGLETYQHGWSLGHNKRDRWFMSSAHSWRGPKLEFEWHNYPEASFPAYGSGTLYLSLSVGLRADEHSRLNQAFTVWPPENNRLASLLRCIPAKVYRRY